jgi:hypothetical protein
MDEETKAEQFLLYLEMGDILDKDQLDQLTRQLQSEILDQGYGSAALVTGDEVPHGAKSADAVTWGMLAVSVLPTVLPKLIEFLQSWTMRSESRKVKVRSQIGEQSIELEYSPTTISNQELKDLVSMLTGSMQANSGKPIEVKKETQVEDE